MCVCVCLLCVCFLCVYGMLMRNYRSHASLLELPSRLFYKQVCAFVCV